MGSGTKIAELKVTTAQVDSLVEPGRSSWLCCSLVLHTCSCRAREWHFFWGGELKFRLTKLAQEPDYTKLMALRSSALRTNGVKLQQIAAGCNFFDVRFVITSIPLK